METIDLKGLGKAAVLAALYNASKPLGLGILHYDSAPMTVPEAKALLDERRAFEGPPDFYFDYLKGRVMKADLASDTEFSPLGFDRDNGEGAAQRAIDGITA